MLNLGTTFDHQPAADTAAVITLAAPDSTEHPGRRWAIGGIAASYDGAVDDGSITITNGGTTAFKIDWITAGADVIIIPFAEPIKGDINAAVVVTLSADDGGATGKINLLGAKLVG